MTTIEPPYLRIASDIRRRIASGELAPGDLVPSTRRITQEWGVAMATATKALAALKKEGLVRAVPGVGTVVGDPGPAGRAAPAAGLTRDVVVATAMRIADAEGMAAVSLRRVATELSTSTLALTRHVRGSGELMWLMADVAFAEEEPDTTPDGWRAQLELSTRRMWRIFRRHPWLTQAMGSFTRPIPSANGMKHTEWVMRALSGLGLRPSQMMQIHLSLFAYVQGFALASGMESQARQDTGVSPEEWMALQDSRMRAIQSSGEYPVLTSLFMRDPGMDLELDTLFEFGLRRTLDGIAALLGELSV
ncbi:TetR/AcrR family transcriptional regulator C-terminal domain-containing protein [Streptomyces sannanensis]|uniref:TetR/AcrR family transcriptional regulator C-terminal domain-containing protein n=1 Tax=Streptomyces sannanensis TaxID=285536 RepID=UPI0031E6B8C4